MAYEFHLSKKKNICPVNYSLVKHFLRRISFHSCFVRLRLLTVAVNMSQVQQCDRRRCNDVRSQGAWEFTTRPQPRRGNRNRKWFPAHRGLKQPNVTGCPRKEQDLQVGALRLNLEDFLQGMAKSEGPVQECAQELRRMGDLLHRQHRLASGLVHGPRPLRGGDNAGAASPDRPRSRRRAKAPEK